MIVYSNMTRTLRRAYQPRDLSITLGANAIAFEVGASDERLSVRISLEEAAELHKYVGRMLAMRGIEA